MQQYHEIEKMLFLYSMINEVNQSLVLLIVYPSYPYMHLLKHQTKSKNLIITLKNIVYLLPLYLILLEYLYVYQKYVYIEHIDDDAHDNIFLNIR